MSIKKVCSLIRSMFQTIIIVTGILIVVGCVYRFPESIQTLDKLLIRHTEYKQSNDTDFLIYHPPLNPEVSGKKFADVDEETLKSLQPDPVTINRTNVEDFVFVTGVSNSFVPRLTLLIQSIQKYFPSKKIIIYNLGIKTQMLSKMKKWCQVEVRNFDFKKYPSHVKQLHSYAFKPTIISEVLKQSRSPGLFWVDASVRFITKNLSHLEETVLNNTGIMTFHAGGHSVYAVTPKQMFNHLPMVKDPKKCVSYLAGIVLVYKTQPIINDILHWWLACALSPSCIWSFQQRSCQFATEDRWTVFANCSRFDQSAFSILIHNTFDDTAQFHLPYDILKVQRRGSGGKIRYC